MHHVFEVVPQQGFECAGLAALGVLPQQNRAPPVQLRQQSAAVETQPGFDLLEPAGVAQRGQRVAQVDVGLVERQAELAA